MKELHQSVIIRLCIQLQRAGPLPSVSIRAIRGSFLLQTADLADNADTTK